MTQRSLQMLSQSEQGQHSTVFLYSPQSNQVSSSPGAPAPAQQIILKASPVDRKTDIEALRKEFEILSELGQLVVPNAQQEFHQRQAEIHPNIIRTLGFKNDFMFKAKKHEVLLLEHCTKGSLLQAIGNHANIFVPSLNNSRNNTNAYHIPVVRSILNEILSAVSFLHSKGVAHGDLKLANILFDDCYSVKLVDFGSATRLYSNAHRTQKNSCSMKEGEEAKGIMKSKIYIEHETMKNGQSYHRMPHEAPETISKYLNNSFDAKKADIYSIGVIAFALIFNEYPLIIHSTNDSSSKVSWELQLQSKNISSKILAMQSNEPMMMTTNLQDVNDMLQLVESMLCSDPIKRPSIEQIQQSPFLQSNNQLSFAQAILMFERQQKEIQNFQIQGDPKTMEEFNNSKVQQHQRQQESKDENGQNL